MRRLGKQRDACGSLLRLWLRLLGRRLLSPRRLLRFRWRFPPLGLLLYLSLLHPLLPAAPPGGVLRK
jgi:hypothetical protein